MMLAFKSLLIFVFFLHSNGVWSESTSSSGSVKFLIMGDWGTQTNSGINQRKLYKDEPDALLLGESDYMENGNNNNNNNKNNNNNNNNYNNNNNKNNNNGAYWAVLVAKGMGTFTQNNPVDFLVALGDNFYNNGVASTSDSLWTTVFTNVYSGYSGLNIPWYAIFGNHDYGSNQGKGSLQAQIDFNSVNGLWTAGYCYMKSFAIPNSQSTVDIVFVDTTLLAPDETYVTSTYSQETRNTLQQEQLTCLEGYLSASTASYLLVAGHYPIYSTGKNSPGDMTTLVELVYPLLEKYHVDAYLCGHDHILQHLEYTTASGSKMDFFISGAAGKPDNQLTNGITSDADVKFVAATGGFGYVEVNEKSMTVSLLDYTGSVLHTASRYRSRYISNGVVVEGSQADSENVRHTNSRASSDGYSAGETLSYTVLAAKVMTITGMVGMFVVFAAVAFAAGAIVVHRDRVQVCFPVTDNKYTTTKIKSRNITDKSSPQDRNALSRDELGHMNVDDSNAKSAQADETASVGARSASGGADSFARRFHDRSKRNGRLNLTPGNVSMPIQNIHSVMPVTRDEEIGFKHSNPGSQYSELAAKHSGDPRHTRAHVAQAYKGLPKVLPLDGGAVATQSSMQVGTRSHSRGPLGLGLDDIDNLVQKHSRKNDMPSTRAAAHPFVGHTPAAAPRAIMMPRNGPSASMARAAAMPSSSTIIANRVHSSADPQRMDSSYRSNVSRSSVASRSLPRATLAPTAVQPAADGVAIDDIDNLLQRHLRALHRYDE